MANLWGRQPGIGPGPVSEAVQDRDALGRPQDHIEGWHRVATVRAAEEFAGVRVAALEHCLEPRRRCFALQPQAAGPGAVPPAWGLPVAGQILFVVGGQLTGLVRLPAHRELGDVGHHPTAPSPPSLAPANAPLVHCSPRTNFASSVERAATLHPLCKPVRVSAVGSSDSVLKAVHGAGHVLEEEHGKPRPAGSWSLPTQPDASPSCSHVCRSSSQRLIRTERSSPRAPSG
jgi:hypothetical protein